MRPRPRSWRHAVRAANAAVAALALAAAGCAANLEAVRGFARTSADAAESPGVVADYAEAPVRMKRFAPAAQAGALDAQARRRAAQRTRIEAAQGVLVGYLRSLGEMAADGAANVDAPVDGLVSALEGAQAVPAEADGTHATTEAAASIAKVLIRAGLEGWRRREVARLVRESDPAFQRVARGLSELVGQEFVGALAEEREAVSLPFQGWAAAARAAHDPDGAPPVARLLLEEHLDAAKAREEAAKAYAAALGRIADGHAALARNVDHLDADQLKAELKPVAADLRTLYQAIRTLRR